MGCTADDAVRGEVAGANRIELVAAISEGGLTPSIGTLLEVKARCASPVAAMVRPRGGGFVYSVAEFATMLRDAEALLDKGADALVAGIVTPEGDIDQDRMRRLVDLAGERPVVCHRAFDKTRDLSQSLEMLIDIGARRVLTSGGAPSALAGAARLRDLIAQADGRIEILAGGGIRSSNVAEFISATGATQVHLGPFRRTRDAYGADDSSHLTLDADEVGRVRNNVP